MVPASRRDGNTADPCADARGPARGCALHPHHQTYSSTRGGMENVPAVAAELGLKVTLGVWIDERAFKKPGESQADDLDIAKAKEANEREIRSGIELARRHNNVTSIVVGNETLYRTPEVVDDLIKIIQRVKKETQPPVTTGEIVSSWTELGKGSTCLAAAVDFIAAHSLPYWNDVPYDQAVDAAINSYNMLRRAYPGKRVVIAEFGWPSAGYNRGGAMPGRAEQAIIIRDFVTRAQALGIDYNIIEAFDQPWKTMEGSVGLYLGRSMPPASPSSNGTGRSSMTTTGSLRRSRWRPVSCFPSPF